MKKLVSLSLLFFIISCIRPNTDSSFSKPIKIIKFMGVDSYSNNINPEIFWAHTDEHMFLFMERAAFLSDIETYKETSSSSLHEYIYAFITPKDTLYSDYTLKSWILIRGNKEKYYYDEKGKTSEFLKTTYPFFRDCSYLQDSK